MYDIEDLGGGRPLQESDTVDWATAAAPGSDGFTGNFARAQGLMLALATSAYHDGEQRKTEVEELGFAIINEVISGNNGPVAKSVDAFSATNVAANMNVITVRGSQEGQDWLTDIFGNAPTFETTGPHGGYTLHVGFSRTANRVYERLRGDVPDSCQGTNKKPLWFAGHSMGGAAAAILAYKFKTAGCNVAGVSLFGSPRAGLQDWKSVYTAAGLDGITQRWINGQDPVACMPPGGAWKHVGTENQIGDGRMRLNAPEIQGMCNPTGLLGSVKGSLVIADLPLRLAGAASEWSTGLIELSLFCDPSTSWDDIWSLGLCKVVDETNRLVQVYNISPNDFLVALVGAVVDKKDHYEASYANSLGSISYPTGPQGANVHVVVTGAPDVVQQFYEQKIWIIERSQGLVCGPSQSPSGEVFCDFWVADGYEAAVGVAAWRTRNLDPAQDFEFAEGARGCTRRGNEEGWEVCYREIHGDTTIEINLYDFHIAI